MVKKLKNKQVDTDMYQDSESDDFAKSQEDGIWTPPIKNKESNDNLGEFVKQLSRQLNIQNDIIKKLNTMLKNQTMRIDQQDKLIRDLQTEIKKKISYE